MSAPAEGAAAWTGWVLTLVIATLALPGSWPPSQQVIPQTAGQSPAHPARLAELLVPQLFAPVTGMAEERSLITRAVLREPASSVATTVQLSVGITALALALFALATGSGLWARLGRLGLLLALTMGSGWLPLPSSYAVPTAQAALALLAGRGLIALLAQRNPSHEMALAVVCLLLTASLAGAALAAGSATDSEALRPFTERLPLGGSPPGPAALAASAQILRQALDQAALSSCVCLAAVLGLLRWRGTVAALWLCLAVAADLLLVSGS
jgi:hypothetical protein